MRIGVNGDVLVSAPLGLPRRDVEQFIEENREWIGQAMERRAASEAIRKAFYDQLPLTTRQECQEATKRMNAIVPQMVDKYAALMGVRPSRITYKDTISRWGSCTPKTRHITLSVYLLLLPEWCIESVVVHELTHLLVANHSPQFYATMERYFPRWKEARKEIKRISRMDPDL